jgi:PAS domain S-box-containing protein
MAEEQTPSDDSRSRDEVLLAARRFGELVENLDSVFWIFDPAAGRLDYVSPAYERIWGRTRESLNQAPRSFIEAIHPEDVHRLREAMEQELLNRRTLTEYRVVRPDGSICWVEDCGFPICDEQGGVRRVAGVATDITARKAAQQRANLLAEASRVVTGTMSVSAIYDRLAQLVVPALADLSIVDLLEEGRINRATTYARPGYEAIAQGVRRSAPGLHERQHPLVRAMNEGRLICERVTEENRTHLGATPERSRLLAALQSWSFVVMPLTSRGRVLGALQFIRTDRTRGDFTEGDLSLIEELGRRTSAFVENAHLYRAAEEARERAEAIANSLAEHVERLSAVEAQLKSAVRLRDDFLSVASHELKTPLTTLRIQVDGLRRHGVGRDQDEERTRTSLGRIHAQLGRLERLVDELLDVSRIQSGHLELRPEPVDLGELAGEVVAVFRQHPAYAERIRLSREPAVLGQWDRARLDQILTNLLSNALKYGRDLPVELSIRADDTGALVVVTDHGIGIPPAEQRRVFERFERAAPPEHYGGLGLGLWIVREIIEAMGGTIVVESRVDEGSTFTVRLPRFPLPAGLDPGASSGAATTTTKPHG